MRVFLVFLAILSPWSFVDSQVTYKSWYKPNAKHIVFIASDHEYRAEEVAPALARILAKHHGFKCTVLFGVNKEGYIVPGISNIPGLGVLEKADLVVMIARFLNLPDQQMKFIVDYVDRGGPVVGLRTSSHAFKIPETSTYARYSYRYKGEDFKEGFGHQVLGNTWVGHYGKNHRQGTQIQLIPSQSNNPILQGVGDKAFCYAGTYNGIAGKDFTVLANSQPLVSMNKNSALDKTKPPVPCTWTRHYKSKSGRNARVFHSTQGASQDILDPNYRRLIINGIYWAIGLEDKIKPKSNIDFVGPYRPSNFRMYQKGKYPKTVRPQDLKAYTSPIGKK